MSNEITVIDAPANAENKHKTVVWWKIGKYFINQANIRSLSRKGIGKGTTIRMYQGEDVLLDMDYDKLIVMLPDKNKV
ncbi:MAG: hypothetical protein HY840_05770 [Bacteroidetes bacterium]|nr:hypothetical protein [Bacteroidota bacterium]